MNLLNHGVMAMPSFADMPQEKRELLWDYLSSLPADPDAGPSPGQFCGRVQAAMAGTPMAGGCGGGQGQGRGQGAGCGGGGGGGGCGGGCAKAAVSVPEPAGCGKCEACRVSAPAGLRRGWSFGR